MDNKCFLCKRKLKHGEEYTSINKGFYSEVGDKDWVALIFHNKCWRLLGKNVDKKLLPLFEAEV